jgi:hypothetical protein
MLVSQTIPNLIGGVSQQPPAFAQPNQAFVCENAFPSAIEGLTKRPPTRTFNSAQRRQAIGTTTAYVHFINRDGTEKYVVMFDPTGRSRCSIRRAERQLRPVYGDASTTRPTSPAARSRT